MIEQKNKQKKNYNNVNNCYGNNQRTEPTEKKKKKQINSKVKHESIMIIYMFIQNIHTLQLWIS